VSGGPGGEDQPTGQGDGRSWCRSPL
jgi:hypothetical protein